MHSFFGICCRMAACAMLALALSANLAPSAQAAGDCAGADAQPGEASPAEMGAAALCLINAERSAHGLRPLRHSSTLAGGGTRYATTMVADRLFSHTDRSGGNVATRMSAVPAASVYEEFGENLGWGSLAMATPRAMVRGWMESPTHRENILYPSFDEAGVGIASGAPAETGENAATYAAVFGDRSPQPAALPRACRGKRVKSARGKRACRRALSAQRARVRSSARR